MCPDFPSSGKETSALTYQGHYPPLYYAIVGLPSLAWHSDVAVYLMRLVSGLLTTLFLGLAFALATLWSRSRLLLLAIAVTATPMVVMLGSTVNPSGLECATAICVWTGGLILVLDRARQPPPGLIAATATAAAVMVLTRGLSPLWLAIIALSVGAVAPQSLRTLLQQKSVRFAAVAVTLAGVMAVIYIFWAHALNVTPGAIGVPRGASQLTVVELALGRTGAFVEQLVGSIGWAETNPPVAAVGLWILSAAAVVVLGLVTSKRRHMAVIVTLIVASLVLPTVLMVSQSSRNGLVWQARDGFPLYAGILLVAGAAAGRSEGLIAADAGLTGTARWATRRLAFLVATAVGVVQLGDFVWSLRRYTVGLGSIVNPFARVPGGWSPPVPAIVLVIAATIVVVIYGWWITCLHRMQEFALAMHNDVEAPPALLSDSAVETPPSRN